jgi:glycerophosphoryl diester phosphodiesterase
MTKESPHREVLRIGHRGACGHAPENTLASIKQAIALRCPFTEVDIRRTADDELVLLHDERLNRTTTGRGLVSKITLDDFTRLDAGDGERPPTLAEALTTASGRIGLILELKIGGLAYDACALVRASGFDGRVIYTSFLHEELQHVQRVNPDSQTMVLFKRLPQDPGSAARRLQASHVGLRIDRVTTSLVSALHAADLIVFAYTANRPADIEQMKILGVDGIISDFPDRV